jgi:hypothetical protein
MENKRMNRKWMWLDGCGWMARWMEELIERGKMGASKNK